MKKINNFGNGLLIALIVFGMLFGFVSNGLAQSVQEWSEPINLSMSGSASKPSMVVDSSGVLHVIWVDQFDGFKYVQSADGLTWTAPVTVNYPFSPDARPPVIFGDSNGNIHIFWLSEQNELLYAQTLAAALDSPASWRIRTKLDSPVFDFDASLDAQGILHVAYVRNPAPGVGIAGAFYRRSDTAGLSWAKGSLLLYESPYFRSLTAENARIRLAVSDQPDEKRVYVVWDDRPQKRVFLATSSDGGQNWDSIKEMVAPQANLGFRTPFNADIEVVEDQVLSTWLLGTPGDRCSAYSWSSFDGGETWGEQTLLFSDTAQCPEKSEFISIEPGYAVELYTIQGNLSLTAWNGTEWSNPEVQIGPSSITNPTTFDPVLLGCEQVASYNNQLFVVGCDEGPNGDIWFIARQLDPLGELFPQPSDWKGDANVVTSQRTLSSLTSIVDDAGNIHAVWVQSSYLPADPITPTIEYSRWDGTEWTRPSSIVPNLSGIPQKLALKIDSQQRLLLSWVDPQTGELMFSWSGAERANAPTEWKQPAVISVSPVISSPDLLVDASDRMVLAYAITLNESRGVYIVHSTDLGTTWSVPLQVFDAGAANWVMVDQPKLSVTEDGQLHILFTQYTLTGGQQATGLYYSRSSDGGITWTAPEAVIEKPFEWSEIVAFKQTLHLFWRERTPSAVLTFHQISSDAGVTWNPPATLPNTISEVIVSEPTISLDWNGTVRLLQVAREDVPMLQEWEWSDQRPQLLESRKLGVANDDSQMLMDSGITPQGTLYMLVQSKKLLPLEEAETSILSTSRALELPEGTQPFLSYVSTPSSFTAPTPAPGSQLTPTLTSPLADIPEEQGPNVRNIVGISLIVSIVLLMLALVIPRRNKTPVPNKRTK